MSPGGPAVSRQVAEKRGDVCWTRRTRGQEAGLKDQLPGQSQARGLGWLDPCPNAPGCGLDPIRAHHPHLAGLALTPELGGQGSIAIGAHAWLRARSSLGGVQEAANL